MQFLKNPRIFRKSHSGASAHNCGNTLPQPHGKKLGTTRKNRRGQTEQSSGYVATMLPFQQTLGEIGNQNTNISYIKEFKRLG